MTTLKSAPAWASGSRVEASTPGRFRIDVRHILTRLILTAIVSRFEERKHSPFFWRRVGLIIPSAQV